MSVHIRSKTGKVSLKTIELLQYSQCICLPSSVAPRTVTWSNNLKLRVFKIIPPWLRTRLQWLSALITLIPLQCIIFLLCALDRRCCDKYTL